eukprot:m.409293 g.409293  ORF g.409293 m.409293 type:complete len:222 (-) comp20153_c0_seq20:4143-4808(-)
MLHMLLTCLVLLVSSCCGCQGNAQPRSAAHSRNARLASDGATDGTTDTPVNVLVVYYSRTNWTQAYAGHVVEGFASSKFQVQPRVKRVQDTECADLVWADGVIVGSPVYFASMSGEIKSFFDSVQLKCFTWPITEMLYKAGGAFCTGGQQASGRDTTNMGVLAAMTSLHMMVTGGPSAYGASALHLDNVTKIAFKQDEVADARLLGERVANLAGVTRALRA